MKFITTSFISTLAVLSHLGAASPIEAVTARALNTTLEMWGIIQVPDLGLPVAGSSSLDKRVSQPACTFQVCTGNNCDGSCTQLQTIYYQNPPQCWPTGGSHSFRIGTGSCYVSADPSNNCAGKDSGSVPGGVAKAGCYSVNTGMAWYSSYTRSP